mmetsp:Transcript_2838/g.13257  ORF Transcript_2838/g.13257 Transcript_2838/m.13257 type:complete len:266 (+) Transcript_2838:414-1211(+)
MEKDTEEPKTIILMGGDIGGTNSRFALFKVDVSDEIMARGPMDHPPFEIVYAKNYLNADYSMFRDVMTEFFADAEHHSDFARTPDFHLTACCLAVAGPVDDGRANFTNRGWVIDSQDIKEWFGFEHVRVVNDFVASGYGILTLMETEVTVLQEGKYSQSAPIAVLGAGTGLGECFLAPNWSPYGSFYDAYPSEGGHVEFAPKTDIQVLKLSPRQQWRNWSDSPVLTVTNSLDLCVVQVPAVPVREVPGTSICGKDRFWQGALKCV